MKKRIVVQNSSKSGTKSSGANDREARLRQELRDNLKKRKAQARAQAEGKKSRG